MLKFLFSYGIVLAINLAYFNAYFDSQFLLIGLGILGAVLIVMSFKLMMERYEAFLVYFKSLALIFIGIPMWANSGDSFLPICIIAFGLVLTAVSFKLMNDATNREKA